jgi:hypothetical protein
MTIIFMMKVRHDMLNLESACYNSILNLLPKILKIKIHEIIILFYVGVQFGFSL